MEDGDSISSASISEPFVTVLTKAGHMSVFQGDASTLEMKQLYRPPDGETVSGVLFIEFRRMGSHDLPRSSRTH